MNDRNTFGVDYRFNELTVIKGIRIDLCHRQTIVSCSYNNILICTSADAYENRILAVVADLVFKPTRAVVFVYFNVAVGAMDDGEGTAFAYLYQIRKTKKLILCRK